MPAEVSLLFEVEDLSQASPATVSRTGMIYLNVEDLGWQPYVTSWLAAKVSGSGSTNSNCVQAPEGVATQVVQLVEKHVQRYMSAALQHKRLHCRHAWELTRMHSSHAALDDCLSSYHSVGQDLL